MNETNLIEKKALQRSMIGAFLLAIWGILMSNIASSGAIMLDGAFNLISAIMSFFSIHVTQLVSEKGSKDFPMGYYAFESLFVLVKGASMLVLIVLAVSSNIQVLLSGGRDPELGLMTIYVVFAVLGCLILYAMTRRSSKKVGSDILHAETQAWLINAVISGAIGVAFVVVMLIQGTSLGWIARYVDQILVIVFSLLFLKDPLVLIKSGLQEMLLAAPQAEYVKPFQEKLLPLKETLDLKSLEIEVLKTGRKMWVTLFADPKADTIDVNQLMKEKAELSRMLKEVYENTDLQIIVERAI